MIRLNVKVTGDQPKNISVTDAATGEHLAVRSLRIDCDVKGSPVLTVETYDFTADVAGLPGRVYKLCPACEKVQG